MTIKLQHLPAPVADRLRQFARRKALLRGLRLLFLAAIVYALLVLLASHVDRFAFLSVDQRQALLLGVHILIGLLVAGELFWLARRRSTPSELAYEMESRLEGKATERLVTLENVLARRGGQPVPAGAVEAELASSLESSTVDFARTIPAASLARDPLARRLGIAAAALALLLGALFAWPLYQFPLMLERFYAPARNLPRASFITLEAAPAQGVLGKGAEAVIQARVIDRTPTALRWLMDLLHAAPRGCEITLAPLAARAGPTTASAAPHTQPANVPAVAGAAAASAPVSMIRVQRDLFLFTRPNLQEGFSFDVRCGNAQTARQEVRVATQPRIVSLRLTATPPAYSKLPPQTLESAAAPARFLPGTKIELAFVADQPLDRRLLHIDRVPKPVAPTWDEATLTGGYSFTLKEPVTIEFELVNSLGFANLDRSTLRIAVQDDAPPTIRLDLPPQEFEAVAASLVSFQGQIEDDLGLTEAALKFVLNPDPKREPSPQEIPVPVDSPGQRKLDLAAALDLEKTGAVPGDTLQVEVRARDTRGADTLSRPVLIHVVPFTRGADEQRRIAALRAAAGALEAILAAPEPAAGRADHIAIEAEAYAALVKAAAAAGVTLGEAPSARSVVDLLETQHYFTRDPRDQRETRLTAAVFAQITGPMALDAPGGRAAALKSAGPRLLAGIRATANYRDARNMLWRFLGMREEALRLRGVLAELQDKQSPAAEELDRLNRRTTLVLAALQDLGASFLELSRSTPEIDAKAAAGLVGEINETGFFLTRGSVARRKSSAAQVAKQLGDTLTMLRPALPGLLERALAGRRDLDSLYAEAQGALARGPGDASRLQDWLAAAGAWLAMDRRLMEREPFGPLWPRLAAYALAEQVAESRLAGRERAAALEAARRAAAATILATGATWVELAGRERAVHDKLVLTWRNETVRRWPNLSETERQLESTLIGAEFAAGGAASRPAIDAALAPVLRLPLEAGPGIQPAAAAVSAPAAEVPDARALVREFAALVASRAEFASIFAAGKPAEAKACIDAVAGATASLAALEKAIGEDAPQAALVRQVAATLAAIDRQTQTLDRAADALAMGLILLPGDPAANPSRDQQLLRLRDLLGRFRQRTAPALDALRAGSAAEATAQQLGEIKSQASRLKPLQEAVAANVVKLFNAVAETQPAPAGKTAAVLARSATLARATLDEAGSTPARLAAALTSLPGAASTLLASRAPAVGAARQAIVDALAALEAKPADASRATAAVARARVEFEAFRSLAAQIGAANLPPGLAGPLGAVESELQRLPAAVAEGDAAALGKLRFALGECRRKFDALAGAARALSAAGEESALEFQGGPERAWAERNGYEAQAVRLRLLDLSRAAEGRALMGLLPANGQPDANAPRPGEAYAWAALHYRLLRSELAGAGLAQSTQRAGGKSTDPLLEFLRGELQKAKQQQKQLIEYTEPTKAYLDTVGDYLRY